MDRAALKLVNLAVRRPDCALIRHGFPHGLGLSGVHEICPHHYSDGAAATGFTLTVGVKAATTGALLWVSQKTHGRNIGQLSARGLAAMGLDPSRILFAEAQNEKAALWCIEEGVNAGAVSCVAATLDGADFTATRRLTLASAARGVPVILQLPHTREGATAADGRWRVSAKPSRPNRLDPKAPGLARWQVSLERSRTAPAAIGATYTLELDDATHALRMVPELVTRQPESAPAINGGRNQANWRQSA